MLLLSAISLNKVLFDRLNRKRKKYGNWGYILLKKLGCLTIIFLAAVAVALMPSPGNLLHPPAGNALPGTLAITSTPYEGVSSQAGSSSSTSIDPILGNQTGTSPLRGQGSTTIDKVPEPIYTNVSILPENISVVVNETFEAQVWISNVTDLAGWEVTMYWNKDIISFVGASLYVPPEWGGHSFDWDNKTAADVNPKDVYTSWLFGPGLENNYSATLGGYDKAEIQGPNGSDFENSINGSLPAVTFTFLALKAGSTPLSISKTECGTESGGVVTMWGSVKLADSHAEPIGHYDYNCLVEVHPVQQ